MITENRTKIVATLGPASASKEVLKEMMLAGMNVARLNFSHAKYEIMENLIATIRELDDELNRHTAILADLQGPKIRIGDIENGEVEIVDGQEIEIRMGEGTGNASFVYINYMAFAADVAAGELILVDDGKISLEIISSNNKDLVKARVIHGGPLRSKKGVNLPNTNVSLPCLTEKDLKDLQFVLQFDVSWIALSFVRNVDDIHMLRNIIQQSKKDSRIIAKIEKPEAVANIEDIIDAADGVMVARGDLGVEIPMQDVPLVQKEIVRLCKNYSKPVIVATQMMESMITNFAPTRAEVNDVANSVLDGADAVMLSGETSVGKFPVGVIKAMTKIIKKMESADKVFYTDFNPIQLRERLITDAICDSAVSLSKKTNAKAIGTMTFTGYTAFKMSSYRPEAYIFVFTGNEKILKMLSLIWGVKGFYYDRFVSTDDTISDIKNILMENGYLKKGDNFLNIASMPIEHRGQTNMIKVSKA